MVVRANVVVMLAGNGVSRKVVVMVMAMTPAMAVLMMLVLVVE